MNWLIHIYLIANSVILCESSDKDSEYFSVCTDRQGGCVQKITECTEATKTKEMSKDCLKTCKFCTDFDVSYTPLLQRTTAATTYQTASLKPSISVINNFQSVSTATPSYFSSQVLSINSLESIKKELWLEWPLTCKDLYWKTFTSNAHDSVICHSRDNLNSEEWSKCSTLCEFAVKSETIQYCEPSYFCGDSILRNSMMMFPRVDKQIYNVSILNDFYDEYLISFDIYFNHTKPLDLLYLSDPEGVSIIAFSLAESKSEILIKVEFEGSKLFESHGKMDTWNSVEIKKFYNGSYFIILSVNGNVVFANFTTEPKVCLNTTVSIPFYNNFFAIKNIYIASKTQVFWSQWSSWSSCIATLTTRTRTCTRNQWLYCTGNNTEIKSCVSSQETSSAINSALLSQVSYTTVSNNIIKEEWSTWSECSATCGNGFKIQRSLDVINNLTMTKTCNLINCPVDGMWGNWSNSECSSTCGGGAKVYFSRSCSNPTPAYNGRMCMGNYNYTKDCQDDILCPVNGNWSNWSVWSLCSQPCEGGVMSRFRSCLRPKYGGQYCHGNSTETIDCRRRFCKKADLSVGIYLPNVGYQSYYSNPEHPGSGELLVDIEKAITNFYKNSKKNVTIKIKLNSLIKGNP